MLFEQELRQNICDPNIPYQRLQGHLSNLVIPYGQQSLVEKKLEMIRQVCKGHLRKGPPIYLTSLIKRS